MVNMLTSSLREFGVEQEAAASSDSSCNATAGIPWLRIRNAMPT
jgi:hypothetical protein